MDGDELAKETEERQPEKWEENQDTMPQKTVWAGHWLRRHASNAEGQGSVPGQGTGSHMLQLKICMLQIRPGVAK